jgi:hypothetical protein
MGAGVAAPAALSETDRANDWMRRALLIDPDNLIVRYNLACTLATSLNGPDAALDMLGPVLERDAGHLVGARTHRPRSRRPARRSPLPGHGRLRQGAAGGWRGGARRPEARAASAWSPEGSTAQRRSLSASPSRGRPGLGAPCQKPCDPFARARSLAGRSVNLGMLSHRTPCGPHADLIGGRSCQLEARRS